MTRTADRWKRLPGNFDRANTRLGIFPSTSEWGIPRLDAYTDDPPEDLIPSTDAKTSPVEPGLWPHFFLDDYRFEQFWNSPEKTQWQIERWGRTIGTDFSLLVGHPRAVHLWNIYRNRWLAAWWSQIGVQVIPVVAWAEPSSLRYALDGLPSGSWLALSSLGVDTRGDEQAAWEVGLDAVIARLNPLGLVEYGQDPTVAALCHRHGVALRSFSTRWSRIRHSSRVTRIEELRRHLVGVPAGTVREALASKGGRKSAAQVASLLGVEVRIVRAVWALARFDDERKRMME